MHAMRSCVVVQLFLFSHSISTSVHRVHLCTIILPSSRLVYRRPARLHLASLVYAPVCTDMTHTLGIQGSNLTCACNDGTCGTAPRSAVMAVFYAWSISPLGPKPAVHHKKAKQ